MRPATIEERVRDYVEAQRGQIPVLPVMASRILHAVEVTRPAPRSPRLNFLRVMAAVAALLLLGVGIAWMRTAQSPAVQVIGTWSPAPAMGFGRGYQTATLLPNGKVLVVGGSQTNRILGSAELYDPYTRKWSSAGTLTTPRSMHTATLLKNGKVLVVGGSQEHPSSLGSMATAELYDPQSNSWALAASMRTPRSYHTATLLVDGRVLVVGGVAASNEVTGTVLASAELYDPVTNSWTPAAPLPVARARHTAVMLADHRVLVIGGTDSQQLPSSSYFSTAELYDPAAQSWSPVGNMNAARVDATATLLPDNRVLVVGDDGVNERTAEIFDPRTDGWLPIPDPGVGRAEHVAVGLRNGEVLVAGGVGEASAQLFDWHRDTWSSAGALAVIRASATATVLDDGQVLVAGGFGSRSKPWSSVELYDPLGTPTAGIRSIGTSPAPVAAPALLVGIPILLLTSALWLRRARMVRESRAGELWVD